jgi:hypothetical protein
MTPYGHSHASPGPAHYFLLAFARGKCIMDSETYECILLVPKQPIYAHKLVRDTAVAMAHELYDTVMQDNQWWSEWQKQNPGASRRALERRFVNKNLPLIVPQARAALAKCLQEGQAPGLTEAQKDQILEALALDNQLVEARSIASRERMMH